MSEHEEPRIKRILVALDGSGHSLAALEAATELASSLQAELRGLFVEDINLLRVAALPMARELQFPFARYARMSPATMRRQLRAQAHQAHRALSSICEGRQIEWTFQIEQGIVLSALLEEAERADLLCVGRAGRPVTHRPGIGSTARAAAMRAQRPVLLISQGTQIRPPAVILYDGSSDADRALSLACQIARLAGGILSVLVAVDRSTSSEALQAPLIDRLKSERLVIRYRELAASDVASLIEVIETEGCGILVVSRTFLHGDEIAELLEGVQCPTLLMH